MAPPDFLKIEDDFSGNPRLLLLRFRKTQRSPSVLLVTFFQIDRF
jgi:hypothetical protein